MVTERDFENKNGSETVKSYGAPPVTSDTGYTNNDHVENVRLSMEKPDFVNLTSRCDDGSNNSNNGNGCHEIMDVDLDDMCEVVISYKCRYCSFLCQDKTILTSHVRSRHQHNGSGAGVKKSFKMQPEDEQDVSVDGQDPPFDVGVKGEHALLQQKKNGVEKIELPPTPASAIAMTPEPAAFSLEEDSVCVPEERSEVAERSESNDRSGVEGEERSVVEPSGVEERSGAIDDQVQDVFLCAECDIVFSSKEICCSHMHKVHALTQFNADFIQEEIISKKPNSENPLPKRRATRPPKHFTAEGGAIVPKRYRVTKDIFFTCSKCPIKFESNEVTKFHEQCHAKPQISDEDSPIMNGKAAKLGFVCPVCESKDPELPEVFAKWGLCAGHLWREHKIDCELYTCSVCKKFKSHLITRVKEHELLHSRETVYDCKTCKKAFKQLKQLRCHEKYHKEKMTRLPPPKESRWYTPKECHICKRILSDAKCLKKHISAVHNKLKPYCCNICGHMTARKAELQLHVRQHTGEKPYKCPSCPFATGDHNSLRKHKLRHSDQRPYACPYCDYRCIQSCAFKKHIVAVHPGQDVVFLCQLCSHASVNEMLFAAHQKDHADGRIPSESQSPDHHDSGTNDGQSRSSSPIPISKTKKSNMPSKPSWLEDDTSVDVVDTGGVTIPASPVHQQVDAEADKSQEKGEKAPPPHIENGVATATTITEETENANSGTMETLRQNQEKNSTAAHQEPFRSFSIPTTSPILQLGQTTYILLSPNTTLPFMTSSITSTSTTTTRSPFTLSHAIMGQQTDKLSGAINTDMNAMNVNEDHLEKSNKNSHHFDDADTGSNSFLLDKDSSSISASVVRGLSPLINTSSSQLLENMPHLDALDLAEVINSCNATSSSDSMFERLLGME